MPWPSWRRRSRTPNGGRSPASSAAARRVSQSPLRFLEEGRDQPFVVREQSGAREPPNQLGVPRVRRAGPRDERTRLVEASRAGQGEAAPERELDVVRGQLQRAGGGPLSAGDVAGNQAVLAKVALPVRLPV